MDTEKTRAIEIAIRDLGHTLEEVCDYLYWLKSDSREDQSIILGMKDNVRQSLTKLAKELSA